MGGRILEPPRGWLGRMQQDPSWTSWDMIQTCVALARHTPGLRAPHGQNAVFTRREMEKAGHRISGYSDRQGWAPCKTVA
jgi:hypothetical protein